MKRTAKYVERAERIVIRSSLYSLTANHQESRSPVPADTELLLSLASQFTVEDGQLVVVFRDNGQGFAPHAQPSGRRGSTNLRNRVQRLSGRIELKSAPGQGTEVILRLPLEHDGPPQP